MFVRVSRIVVSFGIVASLTIFQFESTAKAEEVAISSSSEATSDTNPTIRPIFTNSSGDNTVQLNKTTRLILSGEVGEGVATYSTLTPSTCSVSADGVVTGLFGGTCSILASITGSGKYPVTTPTVIVLLVQEPISPSAIGQETQIATKNRMSVTRQNGSFVIKLNFDQKFKYKTVSLEIGIRNSSGKIFYKGVSSLLLNSKGEATTTKSATYAKNIYFRALINKKTIVTKKVI
jgi:hypothetical protein